MTLPQHLFVSDSDGHLYDTRRANWMFFPLREDYARITPEIGPISTKNIRAYLRAPYAWPGGYEIIAVTSDGALLCHRCVKANLHAVTYSMRHGVRDGWYILAFTTSDTLENHERCDQCDRLLDPYHEEEEAA